MQFFNHFVLLFDVYFIIIIFDVIYFFPFLSQSSLFGLGAPQGEMILKSNGKRKCTQKRKNSVYHLHSQNNEAFSESSKAIKLV